MENVFKFHKLTQDEIDDMLKERMTFTLTEVTSMSNSVKIIERLIEGRGLSCRCYTAKRSAAMLASFFSPTFVIGCASAAAIGAHRLATLNPDYEVIKHPLSNMIEVEFKKADNTKAKEGLYAAK